MIEVQPFRNVPEDQRRTDYEEYDELYSVVGETIEIPIASVLPYECRLVWVPPSVTDEDLIGYVEENIGKPEYEDDCRPHGDAHRCDIEDDTDDDIGDFIVHGDRWGFYQYAVRSTTSGTTVVDYSPSPQFTDLAMSITKEKVEQEEDWHTSELCTYIFNNFIKPRSPLMNNTYEECRRDDKIKAFVAEMRKELLVDERDLTKMYEMCLRVRYATDVMT